MQIYFHRWRSNGFKDSHPIFTQHPSAAITLRARSSWPFYAYGSSLGQLCRCVMIAKKSPRPWIAFSNTPPCYNRGRQNSSILVSACYISTWCFQRRHQYGRGLADITRVDCKRGWSWHSCTNHRECNLHRLTKVILQWGLEILVARGLSVCSSSSVPPRLCTYLNTIRIVSRPLLVRTVLNYSCQRQWQDGGALWLYFI